jgi:TRAP-type C4-dicarboxylate transport system substrate-binding protein
MRSTIAATMLVLATTAACAAQPVTWELINEYPATSLAGEADSFFASAVARKTAGRVAIVPIPDAKSGLRSAQHLKAVSEGRFAMANSVGGTLGEESPIFLLSSLPFLVRSADDARALFEAALPAYAGLYADRQQKLLYASPWPPSGLWSARAVADLATLRTLRVRAYDQTGTEMFRGVAAAASVVSFADLDGKLASGEIDAVLSSGDGGAGRQLWKYLKFFSDIYYAVPLSFAAVSLEAWMKLDEATRAAIEEAGRETTQHQWSALSGRVEQNFARMRQNGMTIDEHSPDDVMAALRTAAARSIGDWQSRAGPQAAQILDAYRARTR